MTRRVPRMSRFALWFVVGAASVSCEGESGPPLCTPGVSIACSCTSSRTGAQVCMPNGNFGPCACDEPDGSAGDVSVVTDVSREDTSGVLFDRAEIEAAAPDAGNPSDRDTVMDAPADAASMTTDATVAPPDGLACIPGACNVAEISAGTAARCARMTNGQVYCWGRGYLPTGSEEQRPALVPGIVDATRISVGEYQGCMLRSGTPGRVFCWGQNANEALGVGVSGTVRAPARVVDLMDAVDVAVGLSHICALRSGGQVDCWGNGYALFADAGLLRRPVTIPDLSDAVALWSGYNRSCARRRGGQFVCWGENANGQLGDGTTSPRQTPTVVAGIAGAVELGLGTQFSCARIADGTVRCWGSNAAGQLGLGSADLDRHLAPAQVSGVNNAAQISAGASHACARLADGQVLCWGANGNGQLGDGTRTDRPTPVAVTGLRDAVLIHAGASSTCALRRIGRLLCWGLNDGRQLGDGTTTVVQPSPVEVVGLPQP